jgi:hypothetical protein|eukprot:CAMPEP_0170469590 /NCGR_PEP_ID=MMETSP0123-20130129/12369_1 /TAXON_ID=182087 /ORGANISM="Favella ehrenbergii, Strain Fehren 1" /LENGTH=77 /DNA_ID=CAMNT_0010736509 /DNA_START=1331 /DNA_END=1564 /DNA_ORIENTATION=-
MDEQELQEQARRERKFSEPAFRMKNQAFHSSYMMDAEKGRKSEVPAEFASYRKDVNENKWNRAPSTASMEARHRMLY